MVIQGDPATAGVGLGQRHDGRDAIEQDVGLHHGGMALVQVDGVPGQAEEFGAAQPGHGGQEPECFEPVAGNGLEERADLLGRPEARSAAWHGGRIGDACRVLSDVAAPAGVVERGVQQGMDVPDGLGCEPARLAVGVLAGAGAALGELVVEPFQQLGGDVLEPDRAQVGEDVAGDEVPVGLGGGGAQGSFAAPLACWQPLVQEELADRERAGFDVLVPARVEGGGAPVRYSA